REVRAPRGGGLRGPPRGGQGGDAPVDAHPAHRPRHPHAAHRGGRQEAQSPRAGPRRDGAPRDALPLHPLPRGGPRRQQGGARAGCYHAHAPELPQRRRHGAFPGLGGRGAGHPRGLRAPARALAPRAPPRVPGRAAPARAEGLRQRGAHRRPPRGRAPAPGPRRAPRARGRGPGPRARPLARGGHGGRRRAALLREAGLLPPGALRGEGRGVAAPRRPHTTTLVESELLSSCVSPTLLPLSTTTVTVCVPRVAIHESLVTVVEPPAWRAGTSLSAPTATPSTRKRT